MFTAALLCAVTTGIVHSPSPQHAGSPVTGAGWSFRVSSVPAGVSSGGELAFDATRRALFITDNDS